MNFAGVQPQKHTFWYTNDRGTCREEAGQLYVRRCLLGRGGTARNSERPLRLAGLGVASSNLAAPTSKPLTNNNKIKPTK